MAKTNGKSPSPPAADKGTDHAPAPAAGDAEAAFQRRQPHLQTLRREDLVVPRIDAQAGAIVALGVVGLLADPAVRARFEALGKTGEFDFQQVLDLEGAARATWYARHRFLLADATRSTAQLPPALVAEGTELKTRMMKVVGYHLGDDAVVGPRIEAIRSGTGHLDLANDLHALSDLYREFEPRLRVDTTRYRAADGAAARKLAGEMLQALGAGASAEAEQWMDHQIRAWTDLVTVYEEVRRGGLFLFYRDGGEEKFPSLVAAVRKTASPSEASEPPRDTGAGGNGVLPTPPA